MRFGDMSQGDVKPDRVAQLFSEAEIPSRHLNRMCMLASDLIDYQNRDLAHRFAQLVIDAWNAERPAGGDGGFSAAVAAGYHKLLAYKDEYEVARLLLDASSLRWPDDMVASSARASCTGVDQKAEIWSLVASGDEGSARSRVASEGPPSIRLDARRCVGRRSVLPAEYLEAVHALLPTLNPENLQRATEVALLPMNVRGYESVKERSITTYRRELAERMASWSTPPRGARLEHL